MFRNSSDITRTKSGTYVFSLNLFGRLRDVINKSAEKLLLIQIKFQRIHIHEKTDLFP